MRWASRPRDRWPWWRPGHLVQRETRLPGAVLTRVAASHLRVGTFEYASATRNLDLLRRLADHAIARHYPGAAMLDNPYLALFEAVAAVQASLVAQWMLIGFVHGVMNTDNMTISGETIDYGPCAFMEAYDPDTVFSSIDHWGRYAYDNQPAIAGWNLARFAEALLPLLADTVDEGVALAQKAFEVFRNAVRRDLDRRDASQARSGRGRRRRDCHVVVRGSAYAAEREPRRLHLVLPRAEQRRANGSTWLASSTGFRAGEP